MQLQNMMTTMKVGSDRYAYVIFNVLSENTVMAAPCYQIDEDNVDLYTVKDEEGHIYYKGDYNCLPHINLDDIVLLKNKHNGTWKSTDGYTFIIDTCSPYRDPDF